MLRVVQIVRFLGIHVLIAGQRFGADLGKNVTAIRAQLDERTRLRVNDPETARMALPALEQDAAERALSLPRKGQAIQQQDAAWRCARCGYQPAAQIRALAALRHTWQHGCGGACGRRRGADCPNRRGGGLVVETRSRSGRPVIGLPPQLVDLLCRHRAVQDDERDLAGSLWHDAGWVVAQPDGKPLDPRADHHEWKALLEDAGVRPARLHDARYPAATMFARPRRLAARRHGPRPTSP